ncbi:metal-dependent hydrolase [Mycobacterium sp.]|uniref:metal-dependent hydrolase n=1 Tax=Mycobacterium sp. TaxID=1785 RepID=UPI003BAA31CB
MRFKFASDDVPFNWQPERPGFGMICNLISFFAPGFEKFIVDSTREAIPLMRKAAHVEEADAYLRQEAQHSAAHVNHIRALVRRWPGLRDVEASITASYKHLTATKPLAWRLAYPAVVEATFTPYFKVFLDHEDEFFRPGDEEVASLFLWHFVEEIEHRSSAQIVYNAVHGSFPYRVKVIGDVFHHMSTILSIVSTGFQQHVPARDGGHYGRLLPNGLSPHAIRHARKAHRKLPGHLRSTYDGVPRRELVQMLAGLVRCQGPNHDPAEENVPAFADHWFQKFNDDPSIAPRWYSVGAGKK